MNTKVESTSMHVWTRLSFPMWKHKHDTTSTLEAAKRPSLETIGITVAGVLRDHRMVFGSMGRPDGEASGWIWWGFDHAIEERKRLSVQESLEAVFKDMGFVEMGKDFCWDGTVTTISTAEARAMGKYVQ